MSGNARGRLPPGCGGGGLWGAAVASSLTAPALAPALPRRGLTGRLGPLTGNDLAPEVIEATFTRWLDHIRRTRHLSEAVAHARRGPDALSVVAPED